jgi:hypothetical protein
MSEKVENPFFAERRRKIMSEIEETGKYPASFQVLPVNFFSRTDNNFLIDQQFDFVESKDGLLHVSKSFLGKVRSSLKKPDFPLAFGEIYILHAIGTSLYKVGVSGNFARRYKDLCAASPLPLRIIKYARCDNPNMLEAAIQNKFTEKLFKNEWFQLSIDDVLICISMIDENYNV